LSEKQLLDRIYDAKFDYDSVIKLDSIDAKRELVKFAQIVLSLLEENK
jgi:hypothetical protein